MTKNAELPPVEEIEPVAQPAPEPEGLDLEELDDIADALQSGRWIDIKHPTKGTNTGARVKVAALNSERGKAAQRKVANERMARRERFTPIEVQEEESRSVTAALVLDWEGFRKAGEDIPCTTQNVAMILRKYDHIRNQIDHASAEERAFLKV
jgi:hypothetical protein